MLKSFVVIIVSLLIFTALNALVSGMIFYYISKPFGKTIIPHGEDAKQTIKSKQTSGIHNDIDYNRLCIVLKNGIRLYGYFVPNDNSDKLIVILHGYGDQVTNLLPYVKHFQSLGYNVFVPYLRAHGDSGGTCGFGYKDAPDIIEWIEFLERTRGTSFRTTIIGRSMGATTAINTALLGKDLQIDAIIVDSAAPDFFNIVRIVYSWRVKYPWSLVRPFLVIYFKLFGGLTLNNLSLSGRIQLLDVPILFIHGKKDGLIDYKGVEALYKAVQCEKDILLSEIADHLGMMTLEPEQYWGKVDGFLKDTTINRQTKNIF